MKFSELIHKDKIYLYHKLPTKDKYELLNLILKRTLKDSIYESKFDELWKHLLEREQAMSTGIGGGIAIPHCTTDIVNEIISSLTILKDEINFQSLDNSNVKIIVLLLISRNNFDSHIKALACVARTFQNQDIKKSIMQANSEEEIYQLINNI